MRVHGHKVFARFSHRDFLSLKVRLYDLKSALIDIEPQKLTDVIFCRLLLVLATFNLFTWRIFFSTCD